MKGRIFQAGKPVTRLSHDKHGDVRLIHTVEVVAGSQPVRIRKAKAINGYKLSPCERGHRNRRARTARASRSRNRR